MRGSCRRAALGPALALALALLAVLEGARTQRLQQDCFCSEIWACVSRKGFPYSECDQAGRKVICCVRRDPGDVNPQPLPRPLPSTPGRSAVTASSTAATPTSNIGDLNAHFRFSTGVSTRRVGGMSTTTTTPFFETTRLLSTTTPLPSRPVFTTPAAIVQDTSRYSTMDAFDVGSRFSSTIGERNPTSTSTSPFSDTMSRSTTDGDFLSSVTSAGTARYQEDAVTSRMLVRTQPSTARPSLEQRTHRHRQEEDYDDSAQEIDWDDGEPHATWSGEDFKPLRQPRVRHQQQQQQQQQQQLDAKMFAWEDPKKKPQIAVPWSSWRDCGLKGADSGQEGTAEPSEWPWHAALLEAASDRYVCGAALVGSTWLLTAAHCVVDYPDPSSLKVRVGELDVRSDTESFTQERGVVDVVPHPAFDLPTLRHDIALVRIARAPRDQRNVAAVCLPPAPAPAPASGQRAARQDQGADDDLAEEAELVREGMTCVVTGWGRKDEESPHSEVLKEIPVPLWSRRRCQDALRQHLGGSFQLPSTALCAGAKGRDACDGDGGGPLVCQTQRGGRWIQMGIVSYGIGCGRNGSPGVYTRVSRYASWIRNVAGNLRSFDGEALLPLPLPLPAPSPIPVPAKQPSSQVTPVSRTRSSQHFVTPLSSVPHIPTTTSKPHSRNVVVLSNEEENQDNSEQYGMDRFRDALGTTAPPSSSEAEEVVVTTEVPRMTVPTPQKTSLASNLIPESNRVGRVIHNHPQQRNSLDHAPVESMPMSSTKALFPFSAGTSFIRTSYGTSEWSYPLESQGKNKTKIPVRVGMPGQGQGSWYSPSYTGSYRGEAAGTRVPGQILSNVAGKTVGGLNRWYSPHYTGSYRGGYNVNAKEDTDVSKKHQVDTLSEQKPQQQRAFNVRPPLAQNRWYDGDSRWYMTYQNGTYRSGYHSSGTNKNHRFSGKAISAQGESASKAETAGKVDQGGDPDDLSWTYLVQTGSQGAVITLDRARNSTNNSTAMAGDQGSASSWAHPVVSTDESRAGRTLVNISNSFTYPSAPKPGSRNSTSGSGSGTHSHSNLSSSYSIYRIYPSVYNPEYTARSRAAKALATTAKAGDAKPVDGSRVNDVDVRAVTGVSASLGGRGTLPPRIEGMGGSDVIGYSHFNSGDAALMHFNITRPVAENRTVEDITTSRTSTFDITTGGEGMDVPPVQVVTTEGSELTSTPADYSTTADTNPSTSTASGLESVVTVSSVDSTSSTDPNSMESTTLMGREREREQEQEGEAAGSRSWERSARARHQHQLADDGGVGIGTRVSVLARRGPNTTGEEHVFVPRRRRPEADSDMAWGERTSAARTTSAPQARSRVTASARTSSRSSKVEVPSGDADVPRKETSSQDTEVIPRQRPSSSSGSRQWASSRMHGDNTQAQGGQRRPVAFHPGVRDSKVVFHRAGDGNLESELEDPVIVSPEGFEQPSSSRGAGRTRSSSSSAHKRPLDAEVLEHTQVGAPRGRSRNRQSEFRRRSKNGAGASQAVVSHALPPGPPASPAPPAPSSVQSLSQQPAEPVTPAADLAPDNVDTIYTSSTPWSGHISRGFGTKKSSRKLKKIVFSSAEEQQVVQESVYPTQRLQQKQQKQQQQIHDEQFHHENYQQPHQWVQTAVQQAPTPAPHSAELEGSPMDVLSGGDRHEEASVGDLEREDVYSFISQRAKRRKLATGRSASSTEGSSPSSGAEEQVQVAAEPQIGDRDRDVARVASHRGGRRRLAQTHSLATPPQ